MTWHKFGTALSGVGTLKLSSTEQRLPRIEGLGPILAGHRPPASPAGTCPQNIALLGNLDFHIG